MNAILDEIREAYANVGIAVEGVATYGLTIGCDARAAAGRSDASATSCCPEWLAIWSMENSSFTRRALPDALADTRKRAHEIDPSNAAGAVSRFA